MEQRKLGNSSLTVSRLAMGTMTFADQVDAATAAAMVDRCLERGVNFIDTANVYNAGRSEEMLRAILKGRRDKVVLASKVGIKMGDGPGESGLSRAAVMKNIDDSLRRLGTDYLDLYYLHQPDYAVPLEETLEAMDALVRAGKVREVGASNYAGWQVCQMLWLAERNGWRPMTAVQCMYNLIARGVEQEMLPMCTEFKLGTVAYNPLAGGLLTGKHRSKTPAAGTRFDENKAYRERYWNADNFEVVGELSRNAAGAGRSLVGMAIAWLLHHTPADVVILGASRTEQLDENLRAEEQGPLPPEAVAACEGQWNRLRGPSPRYNR